MEEATETGNFQVEDSDTLFRPEDESQQGELQPSPVWRRSVERGSSLRRTIFSFLPCTLVLITIIASVANIVAIAALFSATDRFFVERPPKSELKVSSSSSQSTKTITFDAASQPNPLPHCGSSVVEAKANGCYFDPMMNGWIPNECHFSHLLPEFMPGEMWYYDRERKHEIPIEVLLRGELEFYYPTQAHHARHCLYTWRKLLWAFANNVLLDEFSASVHHTSHCNDMVDPSKHMNVTQRSDLGFRRCVSVGHHGP